IASPFDTPGQIDPTGKTAFAVIDISIRSQQEMIDLSEKIQDLEAKFTFDGLQIEYGGEIFAAFELPESEAYGLLAAIIILVIAFGSVLAMGLPIGTAILGLGVGVSTVGIASQLFEMPDFTTSLVAMIGLGVGIDYALFIVTRYRECLADGLSVEDSVVEAVDTSGRAVIFAGITVIISLLGLFVMGLAFARGLAIGAVIGVLFMIVASITFLPALLAMVKHRVDTTTRAALIALVAFVAFAQAVPASADGSLSLVIAYPKTAPQDEATYDLVKFLRSDVVPATGVDAKVGGFTAAGSDFATALGSRMPYLFIGVLSLSFLLLMAVFRSLLVPLKAVIMNLLSIGAAYGVLVAVFQWGWGISLIGIGKAGPIESWAPMMLFAIVFGLSMDYEVFLLSRVKEEYDHSGDNATAVADGLTATARVITAAALIMVFVLGAFVLGWDRDLKLFGLGLAVAVFIDATIVRMVLVPATMELLCDRNWWIPAWINKLLPKIDVEGHHHTHD
ncbi:MAG: MMPL family transporter, partial [Actinomycetota bacterium]